MPESPHEPLGRVRTKIVATVGPATREPNALEALIEAGVDCFRLNASHSPRSERSETLARIRVAAETLGRPIGVLLDLGGPKIRLGSLVGDLVDCPLDRQFRLLRHGTPSSPTEFTCTHPEICDDLTTGETVLFADGTVAMRVSGSDERGLWLTVTLPGRLRSGQGLNVPGASLRVESLTESDLADLDWLRNNPVEFVGLSFARSAADVVRLRSELAAREVTASIVTKIEKPQAVADLDAILQVTDAIMVARGDLGVEVEIARVPAIQKEILAKCREARIPAITATQMLNSMETSNRPTRAEASDVFNAVIDGSDAVMLSGETAIGAYPVETVRTMSRIAAEAELLMPRLWSAPEQSSRRAWITPTTEAVVEAASNTCRKLSAALLVVATHSGRTALAVAKQRQSTPTLALTDDPLVERKMTLYWGVTPLLVPSLTNLADALRSALDWARQRRIVQPGDTVVLIRGMVPESRVQNAMIVETVSGD